MHGDGLSNFVAKPQGIDLLSLGIEEKRGLSQNFRSCVLSFRSIRKSECGRHSCLGLNLAGVF